MSDIPAYWACDAKGEKSFDGTGNTPFCGRCGKQCSDHYRIIPRGSALSNLIEMLEEKP